MKILKFIPKYLKLKDIIIISFAIVITAFDVVVIPHVNSQFIAAAEHRNMDLLKKPLYLR